MNNTAKIILAGSLGIAIGLVIGYTIKEEKQEKNEGLEQENSGSESPVPPVQEVTKPTPTPKQTAVDEPQPLKSRKVALSVIKDDSFPLQYGSSGERVERLQIYLMRKLGWVRKPTGKFDGTTLLRVKKCFKTTIINQDTYCDLMLNEMVHDQHKKR